MTHASGVVYEGIWRNNEPEVQPAKIIVDLPVDQTYLEVAQGKRFSLQLRLVTSVDITVTGGFVVCT